MTSWNQLRNRRCKTRLHVISKLSDWNPSLFKPHHCGQRENLFGECSDLCNVTNEYMYILIYISKGSKVRDFLSTFRMLKVTLRLYQAALWERLQLALLLWKRKMSLASLAQHAVASQQPLTFQSGKMHLLQKSSHVMAGNQYLATKCGSKCPGWPQMSTGFP